MLLLPVMPLMWFLTFLLSMMMWIRNGIRKCATKKMAKDLPPREKINPMPLELNTPTHTDI